MHTNHYLVPSPSHEVLDQYPDGTLEWTRRLANLQAYIAEFGDAHVGNRQNDSPELTRWAKKQRADYHGGHLPHQRCIILGISMQIVPHLGEALPSKREDLYSVESS